MTTIGLTRSDQILLGASAAAVVAAALTRYVGGGEVLAFACSAAAVTVLAAVVGRSVEQLGDRFGAGATSVLQSALGNLPELFIALFALKAGLVAVVQAALIGSILANVLLVLGLSFVVGGLKHGTQRINSQRAQHIGVMLFVSVAAMVMPSVAAFIHSPAEPHETTLSVLASVILIALFALSLPASLRRDEDSEGDRAIAKSHEAPRWPLAVALAMLAGSSVAAAFVSDWFVTALEPAMDTLGISQAFAGLVIVAIAGNAIENVVGIQLALRNQSEFAFAVIINSPLQIALVLAPLLVIISNLFGFTALTLVFSPLLVVAVLLAVLLAVLITFDGHSNWLEGAALIGLYGVIAGTFWWG
ncbi:MAG: calcium/proton exchanger [Actinobacteria bacterium]|nr:calcium/proton exchanger [Actinomycetota bacterium]